MKGELEFTKQGIEDDWGKASLYWNDETGDVFGERGVGSVLEILRSGIENDDGFDNQLEACQRILSSFEAEVRCI